MIELHPPEGKVIIRKDEPPAKTASGILLNPNDRNKTFTGVVVAGKYAGEKVIFIPRVSSTINFNGENLVIIAEDDILGTYD